MNNLLDNSEVHILSSTHFGSVATHVSAPVDMANFNAGQFTAVIGDLGDGSGESYALQLMGAATTSATFYDLSGATATCGADQNVTLVVDLIRPIHRYIRAELIIAGATGDSIIMCQLYQPKYGPVSQTTGNGVGGSATIVGPST